MQQVVEELVMAHRILKQGELTLEMVLMEVELVH
tara:strand:- start:76 stop:177 length:102 start_codon:yes stop_codon:yes gene_type:complete